MHITSSFPEIAQSLDLQPKAYLESKLGGGKAIVVQFVTQFNNHLLYFLASRAGVAASLPLAGTPLLAATKIGTP